MRPSFCFVKLNLLLSQPNHAPFPARLSHWQPRQQLELVKHAEAQLIKAYGALGALEQSPWP